MRELPACAAVALALSVSLPAAGQEKVTLADAVKRATERNPSAQTALAEIRRAEALAMEARAAWLPSVIGTGVYTRLDDDRTFAGSPATATTPATPPRVIAPKDSISGSIALTVPLIVPQKWAAWSHAKDQVEVAQLGTADIKRTVAVATARAYLAVIAQKRVVEVNGRARDANKAHFDFAQQRFTGGVGNKIDAVRARQELATSEAQLQQSLGGLVKAREALGVLVATDVPIDTADDVSLGDAPPLAAALGDARSRRPDIKLLEKRVDAAEHTVRDDWTDYSPFLTGVVQPFYQNPPSLTLPLTGWQAQLILTVPFYDGGLRYGQARERASLRDEAKLAVEATLRQARSEVRGAFESLKRADDALLAARQAADLAKQALDLATIAYTAGATTNIEVIDAERRARDAETAAVIAEDGARQARLDLLAASGRFP
jgi:outer membrane protein TolC